MALSHKDINLLTQKATIAGTEKIPVSDTEYVTTNQIASLGGGGGGVSDVTLGGTSVVSNNVAVLPAYPDVESLEAQINGGNGEITKAFSWSPGYVASSTVISSQLSQFCQPIRFYKGEKITYKTASTYSSAIVQANDNSPLSVGSTGFVSQVLVDAMVANIQYEYTFPSDMWVVITVLASDYELHVTMTNSGALSARVSALESQVGDIETILASI